MPAQLPPPVLPARRVRDIASDARALEPVAGAARVPLREARAAFEERYIEETLRAHGDNVSHTARALGMSRAMLHKRLRTMREREGRGAAPSPSAGPAQEG